MTKPERQKTRSLRAACRSTSPQFAMYARTAPCNWGTVTPGQTRARDPPGFPMAAAIPSSRRPTGGGRDRARSGRRPARSKAWTTPTRAMMNPVGRALPTTYETLEQESPVGGTSQQSNRRRPSKMRASEHDNVSVQTMTHCSTHKMTYRNTNNFEQIFMNTSKITSKISFKIRFK